jgi:hypothetical protein
MPSQNSRTSSPAALVERLVEARRALGRLEIEQPAREWAAWALERRRALGQALTPTPEAEPYHRQGYSEHIRRLWSDDDCREFATELLARGRADTLREILDGEVADKLAVLDDDAGGSDAPRLTAERAKTLMIERGGGLATLSNDEMHDCMVSAVNDGVTDQLGLAGAFGVSESTVHRDFRGRADRGDGRFADGPMRRLARTKRP